MESAADDGATRMAVKRAAKSKGTTFNRGAELASFDEAGTKWSESTIILGPIQAFANKMAVVKSGQDRNFVICGKC